MQKTYDANFFNIGKFVLIVKTRVFEEHVDLKWRSRMSKHSSAVTHEDTVILNQK